MVDFEAPRIITVPIKLYMFRFINIHCEATKYFSNNYLGSFLHDNPENNEALHRRCDIFCDIGVKLARLWVAFSCFLGSAILYIYFEIIFLFKHSLRSVSHC